MTWNDRGIISETQCYRFRWRSRRRRLGLCSLWLGETGSTDYCHIKEKSTFFKMSVLHGWGTTLNNTTIQATEQKWETTTEWLKSHITYGITISCTLLIVCLPIIMMTSCWASSIRQPLGAHLKQTNHGLELHHMTLHTSPVSHSFINVTISKLDCAINVLPYLFLSESE